MSMIRGAKKAIARTPHRLLGNKSIEDRVILEWTKDFATAEVAFDVIQEEIRKYTDSWQDQLKELKELQNTLKEVYDVISEENQYKPMQETPQSAMEILVKYGKCLALIEEDIAPMLTNLDEFVKKSVKNAKDSIDRVRKALTKRDHKKLDLDRFSNSVDKLNRKDRALTEKEQLQLTKLEQEQEKAMELFLDHDAKVKTAVPQVLGSLSEFLNSFTARIYLTQTKIMEINKKHLHDLCMDEGLLTHSFEDISSGWNERFPKIKNKIEALKIMTLGDPTSEKNRLDKITTTVNSTLLTGVSSVKSGAEHITHSITDDFAGKTAFKAKHLTKSTSNIKFSSPSQGMFRSEADILAMPTPRTPSLPNSPASAVAASSYRSPTPPSISFTEDNFDQDIRNRVRAFSSSSARALSPSSSEPYVIPEPSENDEYVVANFTFLGEQPGDVSFRKGDRIRVLDHGDEHDPYWWFGQTKDGRLGLFPSNYTTAA